MKKSDYEIQKIITYYTILKKIVMGLAAATLIALYIRYNPDYDLSIISSDTIAFFLLLLTILYVLNQTAEFIDEKKSFDRKQAELKRAAEVNED